MKYISYIILSLCLLFISCNEQKIQDTNITSISIDLEECKDLKLENFVEKMEIIPLETDSFCLLDQYDKITYYEDIETYLIIDRQQIVSLFDKNGEFIANSSTCRGKGPKEYEILVDAIYNPYSKHIEVLNPYGTIYSFDMNFKFQNKRILENKEAHIFSKFYPLNENEYILIPTTLGAKDAIFCFCDYKQQKISAITSYEKDFICGLTMNYNPFFKENDILYCAPLCLNYFIYQIDTFQKNLIPCLELSLGKQTITKQMISHLGDISNKKTDRKNLEKTINTMGEINSFLLNSEYPIPVIKLINESYVYLYMIRNKNRETVIYDRKNKRSFYQTNKNKKRMNFCIHLNDNVLTSIIQPYEIDKYVDENLLNEEEKQKLLSIKEDNNPIIIKYWIKP